MADRRFRIAFSFAGEKRDFVKQVAELLAQRFGRDQILYDKFHEAEFARYDLGLRLPRLYGEQSELIVPVLCPDYDRKRWTGWEWIHIYGLLTRDDGGRVMPSRFDLASADGLSPAAAFVELDEKTPGQFCDLILERLALNEGRPRDHYTRPITASVGPPRTSVAHNLPALQPFFGREAELRKIAEALEPDTRTWGALIDGPGGMGKTSLAVRAAGEAPASHFDRIVFVSLKSRELDDDGERDLSGFLISGLAELLNELARELGHADIPQKPENQRPRLLLDALRGSRTLLVLDNLESLLKSERDTVFTFVKKLPPGCKAILTSRGRIGSGAEELILEKLDEAAALATLAMLAETNPALARTSVAERRVLYDATAGKPLLLRWTAGQIGRGHCVTFADAMAYLRSCPPGNDPLEFIFGDLVGDFSDAETRALCALTYFSLPARVAHVASVSGCAMADTERALKSLVNRSLVVPNEELTTFTLVPLVADYLRARKPEVVQQVGDSLEAQAYALLLENGFDRHDAYAVLDEAWPTVAAALPRFFAADNARVQSTFEGIEVFLNFTGRWDERLALSLDAERRALLASDSFNAGWRAYQAGWVYKLREQADEVLACAERAETCWRDPPAGVREMAAAKGLRGAGYRLANNSPAAIAAYREALELDRSLAPESADVAIDLNDLASVEMTDGDYDAAERDFEEALRIHRQAGNQVGIATVTGNLSSLALRRMDWPRGERLAREALAQACAVGHVQMTASNSWNLALALVSQDRKEEALPHARRAVNEYRKLDSPDLKGALATLRDCEGGPA